ncbi:MAG: aminotransferase class I/II-fold pyridoxal phosphate-dependent enzyme [Chloroherpetonaceae bacterium]|nr:aminotransferase class I/II-fold pyridoxal phosphate-dependent enzyme [Chthonomonadaceae bacterium]MDW8207372.1 aminotransferase class I/II-fold pyridoxal phosphate-dependent enzyme [Chloroherpetonaceae bacterium]
MLDRESLPLLGEALEVLEAGFAELPAFTPDVDVAAVRAVLLEVARRLQDNFPYPHPLYAGQMLKPPHAVARMAYALALWMNPNNHAVDGGRASVAMEREAVAHIARMWGWERHAGHLTGGGTMANLEALWIAGEAMGRRTVLASAQAHYTHRRACALMGVPFETVAVDRSGRMDCTALEARLKRGDVGTVVATAGTTAVGSVDPLPDLLALRARYGFWLHCDAAYGGYFVLADNLAPETRAAFDVLSQVDSVVVDPHKHGLQPYGCGCVLFRDADVVRFYRHDSPYTYFTQAEWHPGEISLECSRAGAAAVALWATQQLLPCVPGGAFAGMLSDCRRAALALFRLLERDGRFLVVWEPELDILVWSARAGSAGEASRRNRRIFDAAARRQLHLALVRLPADLVRDRWSLEWDQDTVLCLRSCLMKPEHAGYVARIHALLCEAADAG